MVHAAFIKINVLSFLLMLAGMYSCYQASDIPPRPYGALPSDEQLSWQKMEYYMLVHFGLGTFSDNEQQTPRLSAFNPVNVDCRQWAATAKAAGMKGIIIVAKSDDGFCLWPSNFSKYTVRESSWLNGRGDILKELSDACKEYDLKFGLYLSPIDNNHPTYGTAEYNQMFAGMLTEVTSNYGQIFEQSFNRMKEQNTHAKLQLYDWDLFLRIVMRNQPSAVIASDIGPGVRWSGSLQGIAGETNWSTLNVDGFGRGEADAPSLDTLSRGNRLGENWIPSESDVSIRPGWFYSPDTDDRIKSLDELMNIYYTSVGRNSNLLLNVAPDRSGRIPKNDSIRLMQFRRVIDEALGADIMEAAKVEASSVRGNSDRFIEQNMLDANYDSYWATDDTVTQATLDISFRRDKTFNRLLLQEYIPLGQRIERFSVEYMKDDQWKPLVSGTTIGYKRILRFHSVTSRQIRINIEKALASPVINKLSLFSAKESLSNPVISRDKAGKVSISCTTPDPIIYYTTDGSRPSNKSLEYNRSLLLPKGGHIRAIAMINQGKDKSKIVSERYDIAPVEWKVVSPTYEDMSAIVDGDENSFVSIYKNHSVSIDFSDELMLKGFTYTPSYDESASNIFRYNLYTSLDGRKWDKVIDNASFANMRTKPAKHRVTFGKTVKARYLKMMSLEAVKRGPKYSIAELGVITR